MMCHRPCIEKWQLTFQLYIDETMIDPRLVRGVIDRAGRMVGLGDYRPQCKGSFGRFAVTGWRQFNETDSISHVS